MSDLQCKCGNKKCTVQMAVLVGRSSVDLNLYWKEGELNPKQESIQLDPNQVIILISKLKSALQGMV